MRETWSNDVPIWASIVSFKDNVIRMWHLFIWYPECLSCQSKPIANLLVLWSSSLVAETGGHCTLVNRGMGLGSFMFKYEHLMVHWCFKNCYQLLPNPMSHGVEVDVPSTWLIGLGMNLSSNSEFENFALMLCSIFRHCFRRLSQPNNCLKLEVKPFSVAIAT